MIGSMTSMKQWILQHSHGALAGVILAISAALAVLSLLGDSITYDELSHFTAGYSYLKTGDFRLSPDHPPLGRMWAALPVLAMQNTWPDATAKAWYDGNVWLTGRMWLFELNDGERLIVPARCMIVVLMLAAGAGVYFMARRLFGPGAGLLAAALAALCPTMLAHGRYVTTDMPLTLTAILTLLAFARLLQRITWLRLLAAAAALAAMSLVKFSWPLILPALGLMMAVAVFRKAPIPVSLLPRRHRRQSRKKQVVSAVQSRTARAGWLLLASLMIGLFVWTAIWACFAFRFSPYMDKTRSVNTWPDVMIDRDGKPIKGVSIEFTQWAREHRLLPESYLFGISYTIWSMQERPSYLMGQINDTGFRSYFPIAMGIKTPIPLMIFFVFGLAALAKRKIRVADPPLLAGLLAFVAIYLFTAISGNLNIGHRHMLPIYPAIFVLASAAVGWWRQKLWKAMFIAAITWQAVEVASIHPYYLSYFNEFVGGPKNGHHYLVDSNIDWGQDLKRLAAYAQTRPGEKIKLAYFGSGEPARYGFDCEMLPSMKAFAKPADLTAGTYVISVTQLMALYHGIYQGRFDRTFAWDEYWDKPDNRVEYRQLWQLFEHSDAASAETMADPARKKQYQKFKNLEAGRLLQQLRHRSPDERIGYSLFVYHLTGPQIDEILERKP
jgi:4-amino-4-deoxy-L-arabinose transferase-like glycosyltransferase